MWEERVRIYGISVVHNNFPHMWRGDCCYICMNEVPYWIRMIGGSNLYIYIIIIIIIIIGKVKWKSN